jgi:2-methylisocitrate lyase-like PEP mutase family enzyme
LGRWNSACPDSARVRGAGNHKRGYAFSAGKRDSSQSLSRDEVLDNARSIVAATHLPVSADLEDGFGQDPEHCADTIRLALEMGLVGGSIEDATGDPDAPIFGFDRASNESQRRHKQR